MAPAGHGPPCCPGCANESPYAARPESIYSLGKHLEETMTIELVRWHPDLTITALRFSNVMDVEDYAAFDADARARWAKPSLMLRRKTGLGNAGQATPRRRLLPSASAARRSFSSASSTSRWRFHMAA